MAETNRAIELLTSIDATLKQLVRIMQASPSQGGQTVATDQDLDSKYGDEVVRLAPRDWTGPSFKGGRMSQCPPEFLDLLADSYAYFARKNSESGAVTDKGKPKADFDRRSERRARGWAARIRSGKHAPVNGNQASEPGEEWARDDSGF